MLKGFKPTIGQAICAIHENDDDKCSFMRDIFGMGIKEKCRAIHFLWGDMQTFKDRLFEFGLDIDDENIKRYVTIFEADEFFARARANFGEAIPKLARMVRGAIDEGLDGCILSADIGWAIRTRDAIDQFIDHERRFAKLFPSLPILRITNFEANKVSTTMFIKLLSSHDLVLFGKGEVDANRPRKGNIARKVKMRMPEMSYDTPHETENVFVMNTKPLALCALGNVPSGTRPKPL